MAEKIKCASCEYCIEQASEYTRETLFYCEHPDQCYINNYFNTRRIVKMPGLIGTVTWKPTKVPFKSSPVWCPKKKETMIPSE